MAQAGWEQVETAVRILEADMGSALRQQEQRADMGWLEPEGR